MIDKKVQQLEGMARNIRKGIIEMTYCAGAAGAHAGGALSSAEVLAVLYGQVMNISSEKPLDAVRDRFILSKGHSAVGHYAALYEVGFLTKEDIKTFEKNGGMFPAHSVKNEEKGIELSSGSLGIGLSFGIGEALAARKKGLNYKVYVLMGNGECNEGCVWEAIMLASQLKLDNLVVIVDDNKQQLDGNSEHIVRVPNLASTLEGFGFESFLVDGHDIESMVTTFAQAGRKKKPVAIVLDTVKGKGVSFMEGNPTWHHSRLQQDEYDMALKEIEK